MTRLSKAGWMGDPKRGASMGRLNKGAGTGSIKFTLQRVRLNQGGYDQGGAYWGHGWPLYWAWSVDGTIERFFRAANRDKAKEVLRVEFPAARLYK